MPTEPESLEEDLGNEGGNHQKGEGKGVTVSSYDVQVYATTGAS